MKYTIFIFLFLVLNGCKNSIEQSNTSKVTAPNIIIILADDLGYGELGAYGQQIIETPNLDALAQSGMRFTQHYSGAPVCAPARCVLLTGRHSGHAYIRGNDEWASRGNVWNFEAMRDDSSLEGQRPMPDSVQMLGQLLQAQGYTTGMVGKWGLGAPNTESIPTRRGFDFFFGYNCQRQAHNLYPTHLWRNEEKIMLDNELMVPHQTLIDSILAIDPGQYSDFTQNQYAPTEMHREALAFIDSNQSKPFFLYYASPLPHLPLQAPKKWVDFYVNKIKEDKPYRGKSYFPNLTPRATYAAMISYLDEQVGELITSLKEKGIYENTLILFTSDNGPTYTGGADTEFFNSASPFKTSYGWGKGFVHEGGIRVPLIASWPGKISAGSTSDHISSFQDFMPTLAELGNTALPNTKTDGISFLPTLLNQEQKEQHEYLYWEFPAYNGQQAVRMGNWKGIRKNIFDDNMKLELYDLSNDLLETSDVADLNREIVTRIEQIMLDARTEPELDRFKIAQLGDTKKD